MRRTNRVLLAVGLGLLAPAAGLAVSGPRWAWLPLLGVGPAIALTLVGIGLGLVPVPVHDFVVVGAAVVWLAAVFAGGIVAHLRPATGSRPWLAPLVIAVAYLVVSRAAVAGAGMLVHRYDVAGVSMQPTLRTAEDVLAVEGPLLGDLHVGDVVVYRPPSRVGRGPFIKRIVAVGGQRVSVEGGRIVVDGVPVQDGAERTETRDVGPCGTREPVVVVPERHGERTVEVFADDSRMAETVLPAGSVFVVGDHRAASFDSRRHGPIPSDAVEGRVIGVVLPWSRCGWDPSRWGLVP